MPKYTVSTGDSIASIAKENGFLSTTIWDHPENAELKAKRKDPNILLPGDEVFIPERELKQVSKGANARHKFKVKGEPHKLRLQLMKMDRPRKNEAYVLEVEGKLINGTTDGDGWIEQPIPATAKSAKLMLKGGKEVHILRIGDLDPIDEVSGIKQRLNNLGFNAGSGNEVDEQLRAALKQFQAKNGLEPTGEPDGATKGKLAALHP
jgi:hypothetical protein